MTDLIPGLAAHPRAILSHAPTPLEEAPRLGEKLGINLWIKRDDCTGLAMGGNKARQLEFYFGLALAKGADCVLITGAVQSNFVRMAAAGARRLGLDIHIQLEERVQTNSEHYRSSGNVFLNRMLGATLSHFPVGEDESAADAELDKMAAALRAKGRKPFVVHLSIDSPPTGALGYVVAAEELAGQFESQGLQPDALVLASGSALTHSGMLVGLRAVGCQVPVYGMCVRRDEGLQRARVRRRAREVAEMIAVPWSDESPVPDAVGGSDDVLVSDATYWPGYGKLNQATAQAIHDAAHLEGLIVDPVYTGKSLAGVSSLLADGVLEAGQTIVYLHTGGQPAVFAYQPEIEQWLIDETDKA